MFMILNQKETLKLLHLLLIQQAIVDICYLHNGWVSDLMEVLALGSKC